MGLTIGNSSLVSYPSNSRFCGHELICLLWVVTTPYGRSLATMHKGPVGTPGWVGLGTEIRAKIAFRLNLTPTQPDSFGGDSDPNLAYRLGPKSRHETDTAQPVTYKANIRRHRTLSITSRTTIQRTTEL